MNICSEVIDIFEILGIILKIIKYIIPLIIIGYATIDFTKAVIAQEITEIKKSAKRVIFRIMAGLLIFLYQE